MVRLEKDVPDDCLFSTLITDEADLQSAEILVKSKHAFAGAFSKSPMQVYSTIEVGDAFCDFPEVTVVVIREPDTLTGCLFGSKVFACSLAEEAARMGARTLIWIDPACLLLRPPLSFRLSAPHKVAFRPVHIMNIGQPSGEPVNDFWRQLYLITGNRIPSFSLQSFVDAKEIFPYFNNHCFSLDPSFGLCSKWLSTLERLWNDETFKPLVSDSPHRLFLFQAVLSAIITSLLDQEEILLLPPDYSYPYHLQAAIPVEKRTMLLNELTCVVYEEESLHPINLHGIGVNEPLTTWLSRHIKI